MKLIFHIGMEKTGTTSAQQWLAANREALAQKGVFYSRALGEVNNRKISLWSIHDDRRDQGFFQFHLRTPEDRARFRAELPEEFAAEVAEARAAGATTFLISNEHCQSRLRTVEEVARARSFLAPHFDEIEILCVLRPQVDVAVSLTSTLTRVRQKVTPAYFGKVTPNNPYYNYDALERRWSDVFGAENLSLYTFREVPSLPVLLCDRLGLDMGAFSPLARFNEAIDVGVMALVNMLDVPLFLENGHRNPFGELFIDRLSCDTRLQIGRQRAERIQARFDDSNAALLARRSDLPADALTPTWSRYDAPPNLDLLGQDLGIGDRFNEMVQVFHHRIALETTRTRLAECERALARNNRGNARRILDRACTLVRSYEDAGYFTKELEEITQRIDVLRNRLQDGPGDQ